MNQQKSIAKAITEAIGARQQTAQWERFMMAILRHLELAPAEKAQAEAQYHVLARHVARRLDVLDTDVHVLPQGSMRTQTTIAQGGNRKFDLDIVVKLCGSRFATIDPEVFFADFGEALDGLGSTAGEPEAKNRCWRLPYPNAPFYFDVTPAIPGSSLITGTDLRVRDPKTRWSPSNPEEFADWFCGIANLRFPFQARELLKKLQERAQVDPLPAELVGVDDILRRTVQLMKLHRDNYYRPLPPARKEAMPISVILVTLAGNAYLDLHTTRSRELDSPIEVVLELVETLPKYIDRSAGQFRVLNPKLPRENFADRWNHDDGRRAEEFAKWHRRITSDIELMFEEDYEKRSDDRVRSVFGQVGLDAWKDSLPKTDILKGLLATASAQPRSNPTGPTPIASRNTLA